MDSVELLSNHIKNGDIDAFNEFLLPLLKGGFNLSRQHRLTFSSLALKHHHFDLFTFLNQKGPLYKDRHVNLSLNKLLHDRLDANDYVAADFLLDQETQGFDIIYASKQIELQLRKRNICPATYLINKFDLPSSTAKSFNSMLISLSEVDDPFSLEDINFVMTNYTGQLLHNEKVELSPYLIDRLLLDYETLSIVMSADNLSQLYQEYDTTNISSEYIKGAHHGL